MLRLWKPTAVATCGHTKITADICSNPLLALTPIQSPGRSVTVSISWSHQVTLRCSQPTPNVPWTQAGWPVVTDGLCRYHRPVWQSLSFTVCGDSSEPSIAWEGDGGRRRKRVGLRKRMMSRRYRARQQYYHSPGGIGHISHKLWMWVPSRGRGAPWQFWLPVTIFLSLSSPDLMPPNVSQRSCHC